jgi:hypothetical protein
VYVLLLVLLSVLGLFTASVAHHKGYSFAPWWLYGSLVFFIALPHALLMHSRNSFIGDEVLPGEKSCPYCQESMLLEDDICPACHLRLYDPLLDGSLIGNRVAQGHA